MPWAQTSSKALRSYSHSLIHRDIISLPVVIPGFHCYWIWRCPVTGEGYEVTPLCCIVRLNPGRSVCDLLRNHFSCRKTNVSSVREKVAESELVLKKTHKTKPKQKSKQIAETNHTEKNDTKTNKKTPIPNHKPSNPTAKVPPTSNHFLSSDDTLLQQEES